MAPLDRWKSPSGHNNVTEIVKNSYLKGRSPPCFVPLPCAPTATVKTRRHLHVIEKAKDLICPTPPCARSHERAQARSQRLSLPHAVAAATCISRPRTPPCVGGPPPLASPARCLRTHEGAPTPRTAACIIRLYTLPCVHGLVFDAQGHRRLHHPLVHASIRVQGSLWISAAAAAARIIGARSHAGSFSTTSAADPPPPQPPPVSMPAAHMRACTGSFSTSSATAATCISRPHTVTATCIRPRTLPFVCGAPFGRLAPPPRASSAHAHSHAGPPTLETAATTAARFDARCPRTLRCVRGLVLATPVAAARFDARRPSLVRPPRRRCGLFHRGRSGGSDVCAGSAAIAAHIGACTGSLMRHRRPFQFPLPRARSHACAGSLLRPPPPVSTPAGSRILP
ncbi:hypothetical protein GGX14DRAFT_553343 [Mycena pura]|uniref:Uncharacterized protein n=1 Tax=Mycena pura TaxID=153505 RepID=A0AAD6YU59_9AGAR|nr:hypothetical protein GGX14DRAFT_553343 [Mycena pura]